MKFDSLIERYTAARNAFIAESTATLTREFAEVFDRHPELTAIKWVQYTPYFNDGDECVFRVCEFMVTNAPDPSDVDRYGEYDGPDSADVFVVTSYDDKAKRYSDVWEIETFAHSVLGGQVFLDTFNNHVIVTVTRDGIDVEDYDHE